MEAGLSNALEDVQEDWVSLLSSVEIHQDQPQAGQCRVEGHVGQVEGLVHHQLVQSEEECQPELLVWQSKEL